MPVAAGGTKAIPCLAFTKKTAICARVTIELGQKFPPPQPLVMPSFASCSIQAAANAPAETSVNMVPVAAGGVYALP